MEWGPSEEEEEEEEEEGSWKRRCLTRLPQPMCVRPEIVMPAGNYGSLSPTACFVFPFRVLK